MLMLSSLGILICLFIAVTAAWGNIGGYVNTDDSFIFLSISTLFFFIGLLNFPSLILSIRKLTNREEKINNPSLYKAASIAMIIWIILVCIGYFLNQAETYTIALAPITVFSIAIPVWWLVEFARRGLDRPAPSKEWGTLTIGLTLVPVSIMIIELMLVVVIALAVLIVLGLQPGTLDQLLAVTNSLELSQGGMESLDHLLNDLAQNPLVASGIFLVIGVIAPFAEELLKPLAVWFHLKPSFSAKDGYILGLISGGAFALLESVGMVIQIGSQDWALAILLRSATGLLHIGLSGLVGYGIGRARSEKRWGLAILYLLASALLHGLWNSMALVNSFSASSFSASGVFQGFAPGEIISIIGMLVIFAVLAVITIRLNRKLRTQQIAHSQVNSAES